MSKMTRTARLYSENNIPVYMQCILDRVYELKQVIDNKMNYDCYEKFKFKEFCYPEDKSDISKYYVLYQRTDKIYSIALFSLDKNTEAGYTPHFVLDLSQHSLMIFDAYTLLTREDSLSGIAKDALQFQYNAKILRLIRDYVMFHTNGSQTGGK